MKRTIEDSAPLGGAPDIERALRLLAELLGDKGPGFELVIVGGAALNILGFVSRPTRDIDILGLHLQTEELRIVKADPLPHELAAAAEQMATDLDLEPNWLNAGPTDLLDWGLPRGFENRLVRRSYGPRLAVMFPSREDLIHLKVYAAADAGVGRHTQDLEALEATCHELLAGAKWARTHDPSPAFCLLLCALLQYFGCAEAREFEEECNAPD